MSKWSESSDKYCPECGKITKHKIWHNTTDASRGDYVTKCQKCGHEEDLAESGEGD